jgi:hypothetical protein
MSEAQKSYLIDSSQFQNLMAPKDLDTPKAMGKIFKKKSTPKEKYFQYSELYNKYIDDAALKRRPLEIVERPALVKEARRAMFSPMRKMMRIPKSYLDKSMDIFDKLTHSSDISWDAGGVYIKGKQIGTNDIMDYLRLYTSKQKNITTAGFTDFKSFVDDYLKVQTGSGLRWMKYNFD